MLRNLLKLFFSVGLFFHFDLFLFMSGMYQPGLLSPYGSQVALRLGRESDPISLGLEEDGLGSEANWIKRQQDEILAR